MQHHLKQDGRSVASNHPIVLQGASTTTWRACALPVNYNTQMDIIRSRTFNQWMRALRDPVWKIRIAARIGAIESEGHFGDTRYLREGVWELRFKSGAGYRLYYSRRGQQVVILLCAGDKSTQASDIKKAINMKARFEE